MNKIVKNAGGGGNEKLEIPGIPDAAKYNELTQNLVRHIFKNS